MADYWAADVLAENGARVHLAHPLGIKGFTYRRVKNDVRDAADLADLLRMGRLPEAWIAPPEVRELRELVRHRAKLVVVRAGFKAGVHAILAKQGLHLPVKELFGPRGRAELAAAPLDRAYRARLNAYLRIVDTLDAEIVMADGWIAARLARDGGYRVIQQIPGVGPVWAAVFVAEIGDVNRFASARHLCSVGGADPAAPRVRHHRAPRPDHQAGLGTRAVGRGRGRATHPRHGRLAGLVSTRAAITERRGRNIATVAVARRLLTLVYYGLRDGHIRALQPRPAGAGAGAGVA